jgi:hypothetical protein
VINPNPANENAPSFAEPEAPQTEACNLRQEDSSEIRQTQAATRALVLDRYATSTNRVQACDLERALTRHWSNDAHVTQYEAPEPPRRIVKAEIRQHSMRMHMAMFDYDCPEHAPLVDHPEFAEALLKLPVGWRAYLTAGGFRVFRELDETFTVNSPETWEAWRAFHRGLGLGLDEVLGVAHDPACSDPSRIFRLPNVTRDGGKPCYPEIFRGRQNIEVPHRPVPVKPATECVDGEAGDMLVSLVLTAAKIEGCPWQHEHTDDDPSGSIVFPTEDGIGIFHCAHTHCAGRHTTEVIEALEHDPRVSPVLEAWGWRVSPKAPTSAAPTASMNGMSADELGPDDLMVPLGPRAWVCETLRIAPGRPVLLSGFGGRGKSWAAEALALSVASGKPVAGVSTARGRALYLSVEQDKSECRRRLTALCNGAALDLRTLLESRTLRVHTNPPRFSRRGARGAEPNPAAEQWLVQATEGVALCVIDSLVAMSPGLDGNADEIAESLHMLQRVSGRTGCAFVLTAHENKVSLERGDAQARETALKGSAALLAASSCIWSFFSEPGATEIKVVNTRCQVGRFQAPQALTLDLAEMADGLGTARVTIRSADEAQETKATAPVRVSVELGLPHIFAVFDANQNRSIPRKILEARVRARLREDKKYERLSDRKISEQVKAWIDAAIDRESLNAWKDNLSLAQVTFEDCRSGAVANRIAGLLQQGPRTERELQADLSPAQREYLADALEQLKSAGRVQSTQSRRKGRACDTFEIVPSV